MSNDIKHSQLLSRVKTLKAAIMIQLQEIIDIERDLEGVYPPENSKKKFALSEEEKVGRQAASFARRGIVLQTPNT